MSQVDDIGTHPVHTYSRYDDHTKYTLEGKERADGVESSYDLVELVHDVP